jgi:(R,R)-butanediol dehydrogenase / meso-butanediol dehydrogenase / diacetyl reductase
MVTSRIILNDVVTKGFEELIHNKNKHVKILIRPDSLEERRQMN